MTADAHVKADVKVEHQGNSQGGGSRGVTITLEATGAVSVPAKDYPWHGVTAVEAAELAEALARWHYGQTIRTATHGHPVRITGHRAADGWQAEVVWRGDGHPTVTVVLPGFTDLESAHDEARKLVGQLVAALVPPDNAVTRAALLARSRTALGVIEDWAEPLFKNPGGK